MLSNIFLTKYHVFVVLIVFFVNMLSAYACNMNDANEWCHILSLVVLHFISKF
jgi:ABC-type nickel/cobalt efflux system permease component RcnA